MGKQTIISISREYGSAGHEIGRKIAQALGMKFYDRSLLDEIATEKNMDISVLEKYDEKPRNVILSRRVGNHTNSPEEIIAEFQFDFIKKRADEGESFVIVGRCAETVLKDFEGLISIFITGERQHKIKRVMEHFDISEKEAIVKMARHDRKRKQYHNRHSDAKWGDSRLYDLCINSSPLGVDGTIRVLENYIQERIAQM
ncbi:MAG: cytidylate kinase-like family protein [Lachnospiraceae bacterium]|nr:cytidylate kinase-like family protein [Lachnospiraceae bacterium]